MSFLVYQPREDGETGKIQHLMLIPTALAFVSGLVLVCMSFLPKPPFYLYRSRYNVHKIAYYLPEELIQPIYEPRREKTGFLHMRKQRHRSASHREADQRLCFRYIDSTIPPLHKYEILSF